MSTDDGVQYVRVCVSKREDRLGRTFPVSLTGLESYGGSLPTLLAEPIMNRPKTV